MARRPTRGMFTDDRTLVYPVVTTRPTVGTTVQLPTAPVEIVPSPTRPKEPYIDSGPIIANPGGQLPVPTKTPPKTTKAPPKPAPAPTKQAPIINTPEPPKTTKGIYQSPPIIAQPGGMLPIPEPAPEPAPAPAPAPTKQQPVRTTGGIKPPMPTPAPTTPELILPPEVQNQLPRKEIYQSPPIIAQPGGMLPIPPSAPTPAPQPAPVVVPEPEPAPEPVEIVEEPSIVKSIFPEYFPEPEPEPIKQAPIIVGTPEPVKTTKGIYESPPIIAQPGQIPLAPPPRPAIETVVEDEVRPSEIVTDDGILIGSRTPEPREPYIDSGPIIAQPGTTLPVPEPTPVPTPAPAPVPVLTPEPPAQTVERREPFIDSGPIIAQPGGMLPIPSTPPPRVDDDRVVEEGDEVRATEQFDEMGQQPTVVPPPPSAPDDAGGFVEEGGEVRATEDFEAMGQQAGTPAPAPAPAAVDPRELYLPDSRPPVEAAPEGMFTFIEGRERVKGDADTYLYNQISQNSEQVSIDDLRAYYNDPQKVNRLPEVFGTFDNYLAYMQEREELIRAGEYDIGNWGDSREGLSQEQLMILEGEDLFIDPTTGVDKTTAEQYKRYAQRSGYERWLNSDANKALMEKYGVDPVVYSGSGDKFEWNGTAYVKTQDVKNPGFGDYFKMAVGAAMGYYLAPALSSAIGGATGATTGAAAGGVTAGGVASAAAGQALSSAIVQGITTGKVDMGSLGTAALMGGLGYIGDTIAAEGLANATADTILADAGVALDNAIWDTAEALGTDYDTVLRIGSGIATGALTGQDVEEIALNAVQTYTTSELQNLVRTTYADSMGNIDVDNVFREGETSIPIAALNPLIETAVGGAFGEDVGAEEIGEAILEGLTYRDPDAVDEDMTLRFLDPGLDIDPSLLSEFETPEALRQFEDIVRAAGRETEDVVREIVSPLGDIGTAIGQPIGEALASLEDAIRELIPEVETPELPEVDLPSVETPDLPSVDLPSIGMPQLAGGGGGMFRRTALPQLSYATPELMQIQLPQQADYTAQLMALLANNAAGRRA